jgi:serine incorporator 1/3
MPVRIWKINYQHREYCISTATLLSSLTVGKNPNEQCNPFLGKQDVLGIILGVGMTLISLGWTGWSYTAEDKIGGKKTLKGNLIEEPAPKKEGNGRHVAGVVTGVQDHGSSGDEEEAKNDVNGADVPATGLTNSWKLNLVLGILSCWVAMALTSWGGIQTGGNVANPDVGRVSMWMIITSQWIVLLLYLWSLVAPRLFPDRDFA